MFFHSIYMWVHVLLCAWLQSKSLENACGVRSSFKVIITNKQHLRPAYTKTLMHSHWRPIYCFDGTHMHLCDTFEFRFILPIVWRRSSTKPNSFSLNSENVSCNWAHLHVSLRIILHITRRHWAPCLLYSTNSKQIQAWTTFFFYSIGIRTMCDINIRMYRRPRDDQR